MNEQQQFTRMEEMLTQLVGMVANSNEEVNSISQEMKEIRTDMKKMCSEIASIKDDQQTMRAEITSIKENQLSMRADNERQHEAYMRKFNNTEADQDYMFAKVVRN